MSLKSAVRNAHASGLFRDAYLKGGGSKMAKSMSSRDLDDLVLLKRVRPSLLIPILQVSGHLLGMSSRMLGDRQRNTITEIVDETTRAQFNDSIRDLGPNDVDSDAKMALKYHREIRIVNAIPEVRSKTHVTTLLQGVLYNALKISKFL
jgi:demethoxyubiquinone hydroxylase (CLK1/Coq7/Cat5 family)